MMVMMMMMMISKFNGTSPPKGSYSAKTGVDCHTIIYLYRLFGFEAYLCHSLPISQSALSKQLTL